MAKSTFRIARALALLSLAVLATQVSAQRGGRAGVGHSGGARSAHAGEAAPGLLIRAVRELTRRRARVTLAPVGRTQVPEARRSTEQPTRTGTSATTATRT